MKGHEGRMRRNEFILAAKSYNKRTTVLLLFPLLMLMVVTAAYAPYINRLEDYFDTKFTWVVSPFLSIAPIALPAVAALLIVIPILRRIQKSFRICCPHCRKNVAEIKGIVIATKNCPFCGMRVLDETPQNYA
jgi:hypothetical protein